MDDSHTILIVALIVGGIPVVLGLKETLYLVGNLDYEDNWKKNKEKLLANLTMVAWGLAFMVFSLFVYILL